METARNVSMSILDHYIGKQVKVVYHDGLDEYGKEKVKTIVATFLQRDDQLCEFQLSEGKKTLIGIEEIVRITEK